MRKITTKKTFRTCLSALLLLFISPISSIAAENSLTPEATSETATETLSQATIETIPGTTKVNVMAKDGFALAADYLKGQTKSTGVLLLHGCSANRAANSRLAGVLNEQGFHVLSLDYRGYGESVSEGFSHKNIRAKAKDIVSYQAEMAGLTTYWDGDVFTAHQYLQSQLLKGKHVSVVAIGCSAAQAVTLAEKISLDSLVFIAPSLGFIEKEQYRNLVDFPTYFIAPLYHNESYTTAMELFKWNGDNHSKLQIIKGNQSGHKLLRQNPELALGISQWLSYLLLDN